MQNDLFIFDCKYRILRNINLLLRLIIITKLRANDISNDKNLQSLIRILNSGCFCKWDISKLISFESDLKVYFKENMSHELQSSNK